MQWFCCIASIAIAVQLFFLFNALRNYRYTLRTHRRKPLSYQPRAALIVPCKGLDPDFQKNIVSFFKQDYANYLLWFVVADKSDPACEELHRLKTQLSQPSKAKNVQISVAGLSSSCSQKLHNLLYCCDRIQNDVEILAFADSDIRVRPDWLTRLVWPLRLPKHGAATGYRWFVPRTNNLATLALSAMNAKIAQLLGNTRFNQAWGGSMAIRTADFRRLGIDKIWQKTSSDDLSLSRTVKKAGMKVVFVPTCLVTSYESTTWPKLFEFSRRQLLITRINAPGTWWFGFATSLGSVLGLWGGLALTIYAAAIGDRHLTLFAAVPVVFILSQLIRAILRQKMVHELLKDDLPQLKAARAADILAFWLWSVLLLFFIVSSAVGRTVRWRGIRYRLLSPTQTVVVKDPK